jgi:hypothetical protein
MGHWIMALALMRAWGASPIVSRVDLDADKGTAVLSENADVSDVHRTDSGLRWTALEHSLPLPISTEDPMAKFIFKEADLGAMDQEMLEVHGLKAGEYKLQIDGKPIATLKRDELEHGVNLAALPTPMLGQARGLSWLEDRRVQQDAARSSLVGEQTGIAGGAEAVKTLQADSDEVLKQMHKDAQPKPHKFELIAI